ncbi:hypothetical protein LPJ61_003635 [Coemansia biformis]|uniref:Calreticulin-domain-containing protein n=1 Tax=Coemansia biformis TaxID=1286918 RepID=A0A9W8CY16_9FUNG|nr:hypothetical protein LPJ61_003635 [Coemansia biformis]
MTEMLGTLLLLSLALQARRVCGDDTAAPADEPAPKVAIPAFTPYSVPGAALWEQFAGGLEPAWKRSLATKADKAENRYDGEWAAEDVAELAGVAGDKALVAKSEARHHAISTQLGQPLDPAQGGLVLQYEVKLQNKLSCGGAYVKLLTAPLRGEFSDATPYTVMFGPDKCGEAKMHLIFRHRNPVSGEYTEHHLMQPPVPPTDSMSHLYTLAVFTNNTFSVAIDGTERRTGSLLDDFEPPVNPPKEIDDPDDTKPADWEDDASIPDPDAEKPDDWDEDAPLMVPDEDAVMPKGWLVDEPLMVEDPSAEKPADWDDDEDGDWAAPMVPNPRCESADGCGPWERPQKRNPGYKGKWAPPLIDNPRYKGEWAPRRIDNPVYFEDRELYRLSAVGGVGFELWTMQSGITFDNIYLGDSVATAAQIADDVWKPKHDSELAVHAALNPKPPAKAASAASGVLEQLRARFAEIFTSIHSFYSVLREAGPAAALREEARGAAASAMAAVGLAWLAWNVLLLARLAIGTGAAAPARAHPPAAGDSDADAATASSTARAGAGKTATKRK